MLYLLVFRLVILSTILVGFQGFEPFETLIVDNCAAQTKKPAQRQALTSGVSKKSKLQRLFRQINAAPVVQADQ